ncbi:MAG: NAD-dependent epimerase/dehydratase family protein [Burkholderiaceae bacterium]
MQLLILGGGVFVGAATLDAALARGHAVTVLTRGRTRNAWPDGVEALTGDRSEAGRLDALSGRHWDGVIDTCAYVPADVQASTAALRLCGRYLFVSSVSAYASFRHAPVREDDALADAAGIAPTDRNRQFYGPQKAACEAQVHAAFGARATIVRPGLIVGPNDPTGRFSYWPWRVAAGGRMLVPDMPQPSALQCIDVRDLAEWMVQLLESDRSGAFNANGPIDGPALDWRRLIDECSAAVRARGIDAAQALRVGEALLLEHGVAPWSELPLWIPSTDPEHAGFLAIDCHRARAAGLRTRTLRETIDTVLDEPAPAPGDRRIEGKLASEIEAGLLAAWDAHQGEMR